jgi:hypothetical protein
LLTPPASCARLSTRLGAYALQGVFMVIQDAKSVLLDQLEGLVYKGTTLPHVVVRRRCLVSSEGALLHLSCSAMPLVPAVLCYSYHGCPYTQALPVHCVCAGFTTFQPDKPASSGKFWPLHRRACLEPPTAQQIRAHDRHLRKAGPLRTLSAYARDKNVLRLVRLPCTMHPTAQQPAGPGLLDCLLAACCSWRGALQSHQPEPAPTAHQSHPPSLTRLPLCVPAVLLPHRVARAMRTKPWQQRGAGL